MSDEKGDGGPAFPVAEDHKIASEFPWTQGISMRDYFAAAALTGICGVPGRVVLGEFEAKAAYAIADAMLAARKAKP